MPGCFLASLEQLQCLCLLAAIPAQENLKRLAAALHRIQQSTIVITNPKRFTPLSFPIKVDSLRANMSSEELEHRIERMKVEVFK